MGYKQRLAGIGLMVGIALAVILGVTKPNPFAHKYSYWAEFGTAHGLGAIDRDVRIAGVKVGEVGDVQRVGDHVRVQLNLSQSYPLHTDAHADMRPHTLFEGSNYVDLLPGSPEAPDLPEGGTIPRAQTTNYVTLDSALRILRPEIRDDLRQLAKVGALTLSGDAITGIQSTLKHAPAMSAALARAGRAAQGPNRRELVGAIRGLSQTVDALAVKRDQLVPFEQRMDRTVQALTVDGGAPLDAALTQLAPTLQALNTDAPTLTTVVQRLTAFASRLGPGAPRALARALASATPVLTEARPVLRRGTPVIRSARLIASRLAEAKGGLQTMFKVLAEPLKTFPPTLDALDQQTTLGASSGALQLVAGAFEGLGAALSTYQTPTQNPNAPGHTLRLNGSIDPGTARSLLSTLGGAPAARAGRTGLVPLCTQVGRVSGLALRTVKAHGGCR